MKKSHMCFLSLILFFLSGCNTHESREKVTSTDPIGVKVVEVTLEKVISSFRYSGTIEPWQTIPLNFKTTGTVERVLVDAGDVVTKGQLLATLDQTDAKGMYDIALSQYKQAKDAYDRLKAVYDKGSLPEIKWVEMDSKLTQASSSLDLAKNNLEKCNLYAPLNGLVGRRNIEPGMSSISLSSSPLELVDIRQVFVKISVPENEVSQITKGMKAGFTVSALNEKPFSGEVENVSPVADKISRTYEAKILVKNPDLALKPGMVCDVRMEAAMEKELVIIPYQSVSKDSENRTFVFLVDIKEKRARKQVIKSGQYKGTGMEVISGLEPGQIIVNGGKEKLSDNSLIIW